MGGLIKYQYPTWVWSFTGGWWRTGSNKAIGGALVIMSISLLTSFNFSTKKESINNFDFAIPSMAWNRNPNSAHRQI